MGKIHLEPRKGEYIEEIEIGYDNRALVNISLFGDSTYSRLSRTQFYMLNDVLKIRINKILREKLGLIYSESIDPDFTRKPKGGLLDQYCFAVCSGKCQQSRRRHSP